MKKIKIGSKLIGKNQPCYIIAEAGVNHNGNLDLAKKLVNIAKDAGVDAVKFQTWITEDLVTKEARQAEYQIENTGVKESQFEMLKKLELSYGDFEELKEYCDKKEIIFMSTPDEENSVDFLYDLSVPAFKIGSGELNNHLMLEKVARKGLPIILSTGMATLEEVKEAVGIVKQYNDKLILLHCTSNYPAKIESVNLRVIQTLEKEFDLIVGYSDHTEGILIPQLAVAAGAKVIEKHFTFDKSSEGPDHKASISPEELKEMVVAIRQIEVMLGNGKKEPVHEELETKEVVRKAIVAKMDILPSTKITKDMLTAKRISQKGLEPKYFDKIVGKITLKGLSKDDAISLDNLK